MTRITDLTDIKEAIHYCRVGLASSHLERRFPVFFATCLGKLLDRAFCLTDDAEYLNESIIVHRELLKMARPELIVVIVRQLINSLFDRFRLFGDKKDLDETMQLCPMAVNNRYAKTPSRLQSACY
jgi:hypothetical protein